MTGREGGYVVPADPANAVGGLKKKGAGSRSWILIDSSGQEVILDVDKYAIMHRVQIHARDLRILDPLLSYPSAILGRERAIVLNLEDYFEALGVPQVSEEPILADYVEGVPNDGTRSCPLDAGPSSYCYGGGLYDYDESGLPDPFFNIVHAADQPLWDGCTQSQLGVVAELVDIKTDGHISDYSNP
ncbi:UNVERIFIED_CONTAM: Magnesium transporter MRS2-2 [Sesamum radiatum]|uniref:Magnesium transporter MRS2-2 n=1 Tax=Sesamum radiatum TaxID=300843 RepID=A0AAW2JJW4_SESRA